MLRFSACLLLFWLLTQVPALGQMAIKSDRGRLVEGYYFLGPDCALPQRVRRITMLHSDSALDSLAEGTRVDRSTIVGHVQALPAIRSVYYGSDLTTSEAAYEAGDFVKAASLLRDPVHHEPDNTFLLNAYARALYRVDKTKPQSYAAYQALFRLQQADYKAAANQLVIDHWFLEAYWKFGTLCLDQGQWEPAVLSIERFLAAGNQLAETNPLLLEQALQYLTEAFFQLHKPELCRYYGQRTLALYPGNRYVQPYLAALPKPAAKRR